MIGGFGGGLAALGAINQGDIAGTYAGAQALLQQLAVREAQMRLQQEQYLQQAAPGIWAYLQNQGSSQPTGTQQQTAPAPDVSGQAAQPSPLATGLPAVPAPATGQGYADSVPQPFASGLRPSFDQVSPFITGAESGNQNILTRFPGATAGGPWQINNPTWRDIAPRAGVPNYLPVQGSLALGAPIPQQRRVASELYNERGTQPWVAPGIPKVGPAGRPGVGGAPAPGPAGGATLPSAGGAAPAAPSGGVDPAQFFQAYQRQMQQMAQGIEQAMPNAPPQAKVAAFMQLAQIMGPEMQVASQLMLRQMMTPYQEARVGQEERKLRQGEDKPIGTPYQDEDGNWWQLTPQGRQQIPGTPIGAVPKGAGGKDTAFQIMDKSEQPVGEPFMAHRAPGGGYVSAETNEPIQVDTTAGQHIMPFKQAGAKAAQQQMRMLGSANTATFFLHNMSRLPITASRGWFMGLETKTPEGVFEALKRNLARQTTAYDTKAMQTTAKGLGRVFASLETQGGLQGMQTYGMMMEDALTPQVGDPPLLTMRRMADMRGILERAIESGSALTRDPKVLALFAKMGDDVKLSVPYTMDDVADIEDAVRAGGGDPSEVVATDAADESIRKFAAKVFSSLGKSGQAGPGPGKTAPPPDPGGGPALLPRGATPSPAFPPGTEQDQPGYQMPGLAPTPSPDMGPAGLPAELRDKPRDKIKYNPKTGQYWYNGKIY